MCTCARMCASVTTASALDFLRILALVSNPSIQMITQHKHTLILKKVSSAFFPPISLALFSTSSEKQCLPWWLAAEGKEHSAFQRKRQGSSGSRGVRGSAGPASLLQTGTTGLGWSCCSLCSDRWMRLHRPEELS